MLTGCCSSTGKLIATTPQNKAAAAHLPPVRWPCPEVCAEHVRVGVHASPGEETKARAGA